MLVLFLSIYHCILIEHCYLRTLAHFLSLVIGRRNHYVQRNGLYYIHCARRHRSNTLGKNRIIATAIPQQRNVRSVTRPIDLQATR